MSLRTAPNYTMRPCLKNNPKVNQIKPTKSRQTRQSCAQPKLLTVAAFLSQSRQLSVTVCVLWLSSSFVLVSY